MHKLIVYILKNCSKLINNILRRIEIPIPPDAQALRVIPWFNDNGDNTHRVDYNINENSIVFDVGGYKGQWASDIYSKYNSKIYIFEPYLPYAESIKLRFEKNKKIFVFSFGLGKENGTASLNIQDDGSSIFKHSDNEVFIKIIDIVSFMKSEKINDITLLKINIEGGEYDLLDRLIDQGLVLKITDIQVQFHDFVPDAYNRMKDIQNKLSKTHYLTYQYEFVWENWRLKSTDNGVQ